MYIYLPWSEPMTSTLTRDPDSVASSVYLRLHISIYPAYSSNQQPRPQSHLAMIEYSETPVRGKTYLASHQNIGPIYQDRAPQHLASNCPIPASNGPIPNDLSSQKPSEFNAIGINATAPAYHAEYTPSGSTGTFSHAEAAPPAAAHVHNDLGSWLAGVYHPGHEVPINRIDNAADAVRDAERVFSVKRRVLTAPPPFEDCFANCW